MNFIESLVSVSPMLKNYNADNLRPHPKARVLTYQALIERTDISELSYKGFPTSSSMLHIQSWPSYEGNGQSNFFFALEYKHPQTGEKLYANVARDDIDSDYAAYTVMPEAQAQRWQAAPMQQRFGAEQSQWLTEGQWANGNSATEQQRAQLAKALSDAQSALQEAKKSRFTFIGDRLQANGPTDQASRIAAAEKSVQSDGATRFDVDGDGYREVTEWVGAGDAMLGIDLTTMKFKLADRAYQGCRMRTGVKARCARGRSPSTRTRKQTTHNTRTAHWLSGAI